MSEATYTTAGGVRVRRITDDCPYWDGIAPLVGALDARRGAVLASSFEYPGRYTRWDMGFVDPPLAVVARDRGFEIGALNARGRVPLPAFAAALAKLQGVVAETDVEPDRIRGEVARPMAPATEEARTRLPSVFSVLRELIAAMAGPDPHLGFYGAFGYDLAFQFEPVERRRARQTNQRDLVLHLPDEIVVVDHRKKEARRYRYDFEAAGAGTRGLPRGGEPASYAAGRASEPGSDHAPGDYAAIVREAKNYFARGDLFEVVPGQVLHEPCPASPSVVFDRLRRRNPAPYGALVNLGDGEFLVAASPEMFVRVKDRRIETCPISGTIARGSDAIADARQVLTLLASDKDAAELTMCTDVDRNDKSRVCEPGSVRVIGRRQIEMYSRLIHTVDHVEGTLLPEFDALDGFLAHAWAVTVTGAPKAKAMQFIEDHERSPRRWYGGAIGFVGFDGSLNTGLTLRTVRIKDGVAEVRVGATLLYDSDPDAEEAETRLKASALLDAIRRPEAAPSVAGPMASVSTPEVGRGRRILMVDHRDSFVHALASYLRETGAEVATVRAGPQGVQWDDMGLEYFAPDLVVLSPGPGRPAEFGLSRTIAAALERRIPIFGVCLGLQGIVEHFGGTLGTLAVPMHGKPSTVTVGPSRFFASLPRQFVAGRYHSLYADRTTFPPEMRIVAEADDGVVMAVEHVDLPVAAVQFHPESIMTLDGDIGRALIRNVVETLRAE
jgi:anthranilate synthase